MMLFEHDRLGQVPKHWLQQAVEVAAAASPNPPLCSMMSSKEPLTDQQADASSEQGP